MTSLTPLKLSVEPMVPGLPAPDILTARGNDPRERDSRERDSFASLDDLPALCSAQLQAILLVCATIGTDGCLEIGSLSAKSYSLPGSMLATDQSVALALGAKWATALGVMDASLVSGIAELPQGHSKCFLVICPQQERLPSFTHSPPSAWLRSHLASAIAIASHFVDTQRIRTTSNPKSAWLLGRVKGDTACQA